VNCLRPDDTRPRLSLRTQASARLMPAAVACHLWNGGFHGEVDGLEGRAAAGTREGAASLGVHLPSPDASGRGFGLWDVDTSLPTLPLQGGSRLTARSAAFLAGEDARGGWQSYGAESVASSARFPPLRSTSAKLASKVWHNLRPSSFDVLLNSNLPRGGPLPRSSYARWTAGGRDQPPVLFAEVTETSPKSLVLVARDMEAPHYAGEEAPPIWVLANIIPNSSGRTVIDGTTRADVVVPYHGVAPGDEFVHRIFFSVYELDEYLPPHLIGKWPVMDAYLKEHAVYDNPYQRGEFLMTAVRHFPPQTFL